jgi:hypothetical protein
MSSRRGYLTQPELEEYADINVLDAAEADDQISQAEELIDSYVGYQEKAIGIEYRVEVSAVNGTTISDTAAGSQLVYNDDFFVGCEAEVIAGTGAGQRRRVTGSSKADKSITVETEFTTQLDATSILRVYQLAKFPRLKDMHTSRDGSRYYRSIPDAVRRATAAQVQYMIEMGMDFFSGSDSDMDSESIGNYSFSRGSSGGQSATVKMIAPKARVLLRGIKNSTGRLVVGES